MVSGPTVRRRRLGAELRRLREGVKLTTEEVGQRCGWHNAKVSRIETAKTAVRPADVEALLDLYGVDDDLKRRALVTLARDGNRRGWWQSYADILTPVYADLISLEADAQGVLTYESSLIPGLFQTAAYARETIAAINMTDTPEEVNRLVEVRQARQSALTRPNPLEIWAVVGETALRTQTTESPQLMRDQLRRLLDLSALPNVTIQVMPVTAAPHPGRSGAFTILTFAERQELNVVLIESLTNSLYVEETSEVDRYTAAFQRVSTHALSPDASLQLIQEIKEGRQ